MLSSELQDFLSKLFKEIPDPVMIGFYTELLDSLARDVRNGESLFIFSRQMPFCAFGAKRHY